MNARTVGGWARWGVVVLLGAATVSAQERIRVVEIPSAALGRQMPLTVVSPEQAPAATKGAVLFLLHGRGRHHRSLVDVPAARAALLAAPFHIVLPKGEDGWYLDSPARAADRYASYLEEVMAWAAKNLPIASGPARRGIMGWSMGGYGAVRLAQDRRGEFAFVASVIGLLDFPRPETLPEGQNYRVPVDRFTADPATWAQLNPALRVPLLRGTAVTLVLATHGFERTMNENFLAAAHDALVPVRVHWLDGGHEFSLVDRALPTVLADAAEVLLRP